MDWAKRRSLAAWLVLGGALLIVSGCAGPGGEAARPAEEMARPGRVIVDAFLYDAKLIRQGKPTSFRLELFCTDSVVALGGRGYLGKGALRGRMTSDSLRVYFPASNEFLVDGITDLLSTMSCLTSVRPFDALQLLRLPANQATHDSSIVVAVEKLGKKRQEFRLTAVGCPWGMHLVYELDRTGWRVRELRFDNGVGTRLTARLREGQRRVAIPASRLQVSWPDDATPLEP